MLRRELFFVSTNFISNFFSKNLKELPFIFSQIFFFELNCFFFTHQI